MRSYIAIDLKSFYASVECVERGLDPLTTNLVVADVSRTDKTICLAVSPSLKSYGIGGRARLFEVRQRVRDINNERAIRSPYHRLTGESYDDNVLREHPDWAVSYIAAPPRMKYYMEYSARVYSVYMKYISSEDVHVYSIDEVFMDVTDYLSMYKCTAKELAMRIINDVLKTTGITATAGIGTNLYLCKVAMDIVAKHMTPDANGVRVAELDEMSYRQQLWDHKPLTDFWRIGAGISRKLEALGINTMGKLARLSEQNEDMLYRMFGVNAEIIIDHAWGWEPCSIQYIKNYCPSVRSVSRGQVLTCPYSFEKARVVMREMVDVISLTLVEQHLMTDCLNIYVGYDRESLTSHEIAEQYLGEVKLDYYGRTVPKHAQGTAHLNRYTSSTQLIADAVMDVFDRVVNPNLLVRRLNIAANHLTNENALPSTPKKKKDLQLDLFADNEADHREREQEEVRLEKERSIQETLLSIRKKFGSNAILKGLNFAEGSTAVERNGQVGGHKA